MDDEILLGCKSPDDESNIDLRAVTHLGFGSNRFCSGGVSSGGVINENINKEVDLNSTVEHEDSPKIKMVA